MRSLGPEDPMDQVVGNRWMPDVEFSFRLYAVHRRRVRAAWRYPEHEHELFEINVVTDGAQRMKVAGREWVQREGDVLWLLPGVRHESLGPAEGAEMEYFCLHFAVDDLPLRKRLNGLTRVLYDRGSPLERCLRPSVERFLAAIAPEGAAPPADARQTALEAAFGLFAALHDFVRRHPPDPEVRPAGNTELADRLAAGIERMVLQDARHDGEKTLLKLARQMGYSPAHCQRVFRQAYGMSPRQYMTLLKLNHAKRLLQDPTRSIEQISELLGYRDVSQFSKQFKRWMNLSPSAYRQLSH
jgi:AraC-like DNA-binding protein